MVKSTGIVRKVDQLGRIVLPTETRKLLGIEEKDCLEILVDKNKGKIVLQWASEMCIRCQSTENLKEIKSDVYICVDCIAELKQIQRPPTSKYCRRSFRLFQSSEFLQIEYRYIHIQQSDDYCQILKAAAHGGRLIIQQNLAPDVETMRNLT